MGRTSNPDEFIYAVGLPQAPRNLPVTNATTGRHQPVAQRQTFPTHGSKHSADCERLLLLNALTGIYKQKYITTMESTFTIIAEPNRRAILSLLAKSEHTVGELELALNLSQPSVSKHLRVLRDAGFVEATVDAQRRVYRLRAQPLQEVDAWLTPFRRYWSTHVDALERHLDRLAAPKPVKTSRKRS